MAKLTVSFDGTDGIVSKNSADWAAPKETRFLNYIWNNYAPKDEVEGSQTFGEVLPRIKANETRAFKNFAQAIIEGVRANVSRQEREDAIKSILTNEL